MSQTTGRRVLLIDDDAMDRAVLTEALQLQGYDVTGAADGRKGLDLFKPGSYDVVVTDLGMPELSGWEVIEGVRQVDGEVPVIVITGVATDEDVRRALRTGVTLLHKPTSIAELVSSIEALARR